MRVNRWRIKVIDSSECTHRLCSLVSGPQPEHGTVASITRQPLHEREWCWRSFESVAQKLGANIPTVASRQCTKLSDRYRPWHNRLIRLILPDGHSRNCKAWHLQITVLFVATLEPSPEDVRRRCDS